MFSERAYIWFLFILVFLLIFKPVEWFLPEEEPAYLTEEQSLAYLKDIGEYIPELYHLSKSQREVIDDLYTEIEELKSTNWYTKYELTKSELDSTRANQPSLILVAYFTGLLGFSIAFSVTWFAYRKTRENRIERISDLENQVKEYKTKILELKKERKEWKKS